jgi:hypothetical protein
MMPIVRVGNTYYFIYLLFGALFTLLLIKVLRRLKDQQQRHLLFGMLIGGLFLHIFKVFLPPYNTLDYPIRKLTLENICAVSTVIFPIVFLTNNKTLKDYMIMAGILSGLLAFMYPANAISSDFDGTFVGLKHAFSFEVIRFYVSHWLLFAVPFSMMHFKMHTLSIKRVLRPPVILISVFFLIYINELVLTKIGWVPKEDLYNPEGRNPSLIFGLSSTFKNAGAILLILVPSFLLVHPITKEAFSWPVLWMILPVFIYATLLSLLFVAIYDSDDTKTFFEKLFSHLKPVRR